MQIYILCIVLDRSTRGRLSFTTFRLYITGAPRHGRDDGDFMNIFNCCHALFQIIASVPCESTKIVEVILLYGQQFGWQLFQITGYFARNRAFDDRFEQSLIIEANSLFRHRWACVLPSLPFYTHTDTHIHTLGSDCKDRWRRTENGSQKQVGPLEGRSSIRANTLAIGLNKITSTHTHNRRHTLVIVDQVAATIDRSWSWSTQPRGTQWK